MSYSLPDLPYASDALAPHISARTMAYHHGKHHRAYVDKLNDLIEGTPLADKALEEIIRTTAKDREAAGIFNNAAQVWNHSFYWKSMKPGGGGPPTGTVAELIKATFGGREQFTEALKTAGLTQFGSGWAWLVFNEGALEIVKTANAETPIVEGLQPLMTVDVWEHAYYLDHQNRRGDYLDVFLEHLVNWDFINENLS